MATNFTADRINNKIKERGFIKRIEGKKSDEKSKGKSDKAPEKKTKGDTERRR